MFTYLPAFQFKGHSTFHRIKGGAKPDKFVELFAGLDAIADLDRDVEAEMELVFGGRHGE